MGEAGDEIGEGLISPRDPSPPFSPNPARTGSRFPARNALHDFAHVPTSPLRSGSRGFSYVGANAILNSSRFTDSPINDLTIQLI